MATRGDTLARPPCRLCTDSKKYRGTLSGDKMSIEFADHKEGIHDEVMAVKFSKAAPDPSNGGGQATIKVEGAKVSSHCDSWAWSDDGVNWWGPACCCACPPRARRRRHEQPRP